MLAVLSSTAEATVSSFFDKEGTKLPARLGRLPSNVSFVIPGKRMKRDKQMLGNATAEIRHQNIRNIGGLSLVSVLWRKCVSIHTAR